MSRRLATAEDEADIQRLVAMWLDLGIVTAETAERGRSAALASGGRIDQVLNKLGLVPDDAFAEGWAAITGWPITSDWPPEPLDIPGLPRRFLAHARLVPLRLEGGALHLAVGDPLDAFSRSAVAAKTGLRVVPSVARPAELQLHLGRLEDDAGEPEAQPSGGIASDVDRLRDLASDAPAIRALETVIDRAVAARASDIHLLPTVTGGRLRIRVDGVLHDVSSMPRELCAALASRLKVMAGLDIAETRLPQDGRLRLPYRGQELDLRMGTVPQVHGEGVVLRVLHRAKATPQLEDLELPADVTAELLRIVATPNGLLLVTGPTGSGKTTTLYATLARLARPDRNIITVEDPVEHGLDGVAQIQVDRRIGFDFAQALRAVLRHDPDVVMIGEIRDAETAAIAVRAALTGHLVLATVHTNSAAAAIPRMLDMGVEPWLLSSTLRGAMAQRLLRRLCPHCKRVVAAAEAPADPGGFEAVGCDRCGGSGYQGRLAIAEFVAAVPRPAGSSSSETGIAQERTPERTLHDDAMDRVRAGATSLAEVRRVLGDRPEAAGAWT